MKLIIYVDLKMLTRLLKVFFVISLLTEPLILHAQQNTLPVISGIRQKTPIEPYLEQASKSTSYRFYYDEKLLKTIYLEPDDNGTPLLQYLKKSLAAKGIVCIVYKQKNIILVDKSKLQLNEQLKKVKKFENGERATIVDVGDPMLAGKYKKAVISGFITDGKTGDPLPGAVIQVEGKSSGTITDPDGRYSISVPAGHNKIKFSYVGFEDKEILVNVYSPGKLNVELFQSTVAIDQVTVTSNADANVKSTQMSVVHLDAKTINSIPVLMGEPDIMKAMTLLPGIQSTGDIASGFNVRGGGTDENLILIDDVPIYNATHLFGMFSVIDTRSIAKLELYKGGAPASYGGRASSVMDITLADGNYKKWQGNGSLGLFSSTLTLKGPLKKDKTSIIIGGRTTYSDWILKKVPNIEIRNSQADFYDLNAKITSKLNDKNRLSAFGYFSHDRFNLAGTNLYQYDNKLASLKWNHIAGNNLTYSLSGFITDYSSGLTDNSQDSSGYTITTGIRQLGTRFRALYSKGSNNSLQFGLEGNYFTFFPGSKEPYHSDVSTVKLNNEQASTFAAYAQERYDITPQLSVSGGLRFSYFMLLGPVSVNQYSGNYPSSTTHIWTKNYSKGKIVKTYGGLAPRLNIKYSIDLSSSVKFGLSRNYQYMHVISNTTLITPTDTWRPCGPYIKPAIGDQVVAGYFRNFEKGAIESSIEVYYKKVKNVLDYKNGATLVLNDSLEQDLLSGHLNAYGVEFLFRKNSGRLTGWVSYTYSRSFMQTTGAPKKDLINNGRKYPSNYDKPNDLSIVASYKLSRRFTLGSSFTYSTGRPFTYPETKVTIFNNVLINNSDRNKYRLKDYNRLDLSLTWNTSLRRHKKFYSSWTLSIYNVYGRKNVYSAYYKRDVPTAKNNYQLYSFYQLSIIGIPIPSLTYNLRF